MTEVNYELCEECQKRMDEAFAEDGIYGLTLDEMIEQEVLIPFTMAVDLAIEGHHVKRNNDTTCFTISDIEIDGSGVKTTQICVLDTEGNVISIKDGFNIEEVLAEDFIIVK